MIAEKDLCFLPVSPIHKFWQMLGFWSGFVGFICYPLSFTSMALSGELTLWKFTIYYQVAYISLGLILFPDLGIQLGHANYLGPLVLILTYVLGVTRQRYGIQSRNGTASMMNLISSAEFALMSFSTSKLKGLQYEGGISSFFLVCLLVQLLKMKYVVTSIGAVLFWRAYVSLRLYYLYKLEWLRQFKEDLFSAKFGDHTSLSQGWLLINIGGLFDVGLFLNLFAEILMK